MQNPESPPIRAIISNGTGLFPLAWIAAEVAKRDRLDCFITAGYPTQSVSRLADRIQLLTGNINRLKARKVDLPDENINPIWSSEFFYQTAHVLRGRKWASTLFDVADNAAFRVYASQAKRILKSMPLSNSRPIYHYRAGFGLDSVAEAKRRGMIALCHHTSAHPIAFGPLTRLQGKRPTPEQIMEERANLEGVYKLFLWDIDQADFIIAESEFEVETFRWCGHTKDNIKPLYPGIDPVFRSYIPERPLRRSGPPRVLFAGGLTENKGASILQSALALAPGLDLTLEIAGGISPEAGKRYHQLLNDPRVSSLGIMPRAQLAKKMTDSDIFLLPTCLEGSARVLFESLACGCFVITTPNSGTVAKHEINGLIIPPGDPEAVIAALEQATSMMGQWREIALRNQDLVAREYGPERFIDSIINVYDELVMAKPKHISSL
jgi:glycosyltransferase involved in cell wall biosynthesis